MKGTIRKIHPEKTSRNGNRFIRVEFLMEDKSWAATDLCPDFRNWERWKVLLQVGRQIEGLELKANNKVDADSFVQEIAIKRNGHWERTETGMRFVYDDEKELRIPEYKNGIGVWSVPSTTPRFNKYEVVDHGHIMTCDCEGYRYHHKCKHIDQVKKKIKEARQNEFKARQQKML